MPRKIEQKVAATTQKPEKWRWYHGIVFYITIQILTFGLSGLVSVATGYKGRSTRDIFFGDVSYFRRLKQSRITPPSWVFAPAWTINNLSVIYGNLRVLNMPDDTPGRKTYLALQAATWLDYIAFNASYFILRSPINALILTILYLILTVASVFVSIFRLKDTKVALAFATLVIWLIVATTAAIAQVLWNKDDLYQAGPFVEPSAQLVKEYVA
jgi:tryptophan-rich sensory protein